MSDTEDLHTDEFPIQTPEMPPPVDQHVKKPERPTPPMLPLLEDAFQNMTLVEATHITHLHRANSFEVAIILAIFIASLLRLRFSSSMDRLPMIPLLTMPCTAYVKLDAQLDGTALQVSNAQFQDVLDGEHPPGRLLLPQEGGCLPGLQAHDAETRGALSGGTTLHTNQPHRRTGSKLIAPSPGSKLIAPSPGSKLIARRPSSKLIAPSPGSKLITHPPSSKLIAHRHNLPTDCRKPGPNPVPAQPSPAQRGHTHQWRTDGEGNQAGTSINFY
ncbi:hypothetical protein B9Z55_004974 [Caenorhabditis nigoni]|uniref:Uncharacterized protein n=1 Tax=Caenorhabditis nigoni TaxID=1611254 RepID=A0A2G5UYU9_9PELO|nr:hypothetical protein B9Z55_004974 [Caenorhabditis nigoni]